MASGYVLIMANYEGMLLFEKKVKGRKGFDCLVKDLKSDEAPFYLWLMNTKFIGLDSELVVSDA